MTTKKSEKANLENKKNIFILMGFVMALSFVFITFEWSKDKVIYDDIASANNGFDDGDLIPITMPETPPPPPPPLPKVINEFVIVDKPVPTTGFDIPQIDDPIDIPTYKKPDEPVEIIEPIEIWVEHMPEFNGNIGEYLSKAIKYPTIAIEHEIQGKVYCEFVVNKDGSIVDVKIVKGIDRSLDEEAMRVIKSMPSWKPGKVNGKPVRVRYTLPVNFKLM